MAVGIANSDESLESGTLTGTGLLLDRHDLHDLVLELGEQKVDNLVLLDGEGEEVDLFNRLDLSVTNQATELCDGYPFLLFVALCASTSSTTPSATISTSSPAKSTS